jgi:hypothetical protein
MVKRPKEDIINPSGDWFDNNMSPVQKKKPFLIISSMIYLCNTVTDHDIKARILKLIDDNPNIPIYKLGFLNDWDKEPLWK